MYKHNVHLFTKVIIQPVWSAKVYKASSHLPATRAFNMGLCPSIVNFREVSFIPLLLPTTAPAHLVAQNVNEQFVLECRK